MSLLSLSQKNTFSTLKILNKKSQHHIKTSQIFALRKRRDTFNNSLLSFKIKSLSLPWYSTLEKRKCYCYIYSKSYVSLIKNILILKSTSSLSHRSITSHQLWLLLAWHFIKNVSLFLYSLLYSFYDLISHSHHSFKISLQLNSSISQSRIILTMSNVLNANWSLANENHTIMHLQSMLIVYFNVNYYIYH